MPGTWSTLLEWRSGDGFGRDTDDTDTKGGGTTLSVQDACPDPSVVVSRQPPVFEVMYVSGQG